VKYGPAAVEGEGTRRVQGLIGMWGAVVRAGRWTPQSRTSFDANGRLQPACSLSKPSQSRLTRTIFRGWYGLFRSLPTSVGLHELQWQTTGISARMPISSRPLRPRNRWWHHDSIRGPLQGWSSVPRREFSSQRPNGLIDHRPATHPHPHRAPRSSSQHRRRCPREVRVHPSWCLRVRKATRCWPLSRRCHGSTATSRPTMPLA